MFGGIPLSLFVGLLIVLVLLYQSVWILNEYERGVVFRLGRFQAVREAGLRFVIPFVDRLVKVSLREIVMDVPSQDVITRDNVSVKVNAVVYFRVLHPEDAIIKVENFHYGTSQLAQTTLRSICGQGELDRILSELDAINRQLQAELDRGTDPWGVKVRAVEIKHIDLPQEMQRAMAKQAEAERERRAKVIHAEGEFQASERLREASDVMAKSPYTLQLRYLQTLSEISSEQNSTILFPIPLDLISPILEARRLRESGESGESGSQA